MNLFSFLPGGPLQRGTLISKFFHRIIFSAFFSTLLFFGTIKAQKFENLALTPPMGWNSWNRFACDINEQLIRETIDAMANSGMRDAGYEYVVIDDCWQIARNAEGKILADPERFPSGIKALADYAHEKGLKFGLYSDAGRKTCQERPGSHGFEEIDAQTYAEWGIDYLKYDWCHTRGIDPKIAYPVMRDALYKANHPILFSICEWGFSKPWTWARDVGHLWRTTGDIVDRWRGLGIFLVGFTQIIDKQVGLEQYAGPGHWNDPDMLQIGNGHMKYNEYRAHFSMWCMLAAPLMAGNDLRSMSPEILDLLTKKEVIAIDQDPLGKQASKILDYGKHEVWLKPLSNGEFAVCFFNRSKKPWHVDFDWQSIRIPKNQIIRDLWKEENIGNAERNLQESIPGHDILLLRCFFPNK